VSDLQCPARVYVVRHADAEPTGASYDAGGALTEKGRAQARALAESLRGARIARVHASTMRRARETGEAVAAALGVGLEVHEGLCEVGVESEDAVVARVAAELDAIADQHRGEAVLVVGHQAALGLTLARLVPRGTGVPAWSGDGDFPIVLEGDADGWVVRPDARRLG
jgi:broad specificity phosphatase PhoE